MQAKVRVRLLQKALTSEGKSSPEIVEEKKSSYHHRITNIIRNHNYKIVIVV